MFYCKGVGKEKEIKRRGTAKKLVVMPDGDKLFSELQYNEKAAELQVTEGKYVMCLCTEVGIAEEAEFEIVMVNNSEMLVTLLKGFIYVRSEQGHIVKLSTKGKADYVPKDEGIHWFKRSDYRTYAAVRLAKAYNVPMNSKAVETVYEYDITYIYRMEKDEGTLRVLCLGFRETLGNTEVPQKPGSPAWQPPKPARPKKEWSY